MARLSRQEAEPIIEAKVNAYRERSYAELVALIGQEPEAREGVLPSGACYCFEIQVVWDDRKGGDVRVLGEIIESPSYPLFWWFLTLRWSRIFGGFSADFILSPTGEFIGEGWMSGSHTDA